MIGKTTLPDTFLDVSRLSFGTASLHHLYSSRSRQSLLQSALDIGITHFDTSPYYGYGLAEKELGIFQKRSRVDITIATKVGLYPRSTKFPSTLTVWARKVIGKVMPEISLPVVNFTIALAEKSLELSLRRLKKECVDILYLHEPNPDIVNTDEFLSWLLVQKHKGKLRYFGLAGHSGPMESWLKDKSPVAAVLQVKDSLSEHEADNVLKHNRSFQITYGYLSSAKDGTYCGTKEDMLIEALQRNRTGSVLFSTRRLERLTRLRDKLQLEFL
jgi:aryl-alcohol dehydrogenase-like predicted oxidoreductase